VVEGDKSGQAPKPRPEPARAGLLRPLAVVAVATIALVSSATAAVWIARDPAPPTYATGSPEAAYASVVDAMQRHDQAAAMKMVSARGQLEGMVVGELMACSNGDTCTLTVNGSQTSGDSTTPDVTMRMTFGAGFGSSTYTSYQTVGLIRVDGVWQIDTLTIRGK